MPSHEEHCRQSHRKYGKSFSELHRWMDEPVKGLGRSHRMHRHDLKRTPAEARKLFGEMADHACIDHILLDRDKSGLPSKQDEEVPIGMWLIGFGTAFYWMWLIMVSTGGGLFVGTFLYNLLWMAAFAGFSYFGWGKEGKGALLVFLPTFILSTAGFLFEREWMVGVGALNLVVSFVSTPGAQPDLGMRGSCVFAHLLPLITALGGCILSSTKFPWIFLLFALVLSTIYTWKAAKGIELQSKARGLKKRRRSPRGISVRSIVLWHGRLKKKGKSFRLSNFDSQISRYERLKRRRKPTAA